MYSYTKNNINLLIDVYIVTFILHLLYKLNQKPQNQKAETEKYSRADQVS